MDRGTRNLVVLAIVVIALLFFFSGRTIPGIRNPFGNVNLNPPADTSVNPNNPPSQPINPSSNVAVDVNTTNRGPLISLEQPPGFLSGILHGLLAPFMLVAGLFIAGVRMYAINNIGAVYDFGFLLGLLLLLALFAAPRYYYHRRHYHG